MHESSCPHVITIGDWSPEDIADKERKSRCETCGEKEAGLWCCLYRDCGYVGCGEKRADHSAVHFASNQEHSLMINLRSRRIWCHTCETEVHLDNNMPAPCRSSLHPGVAESDRSSDDLIRRPLGLAGLQNLGNTCYMNAALQALSNCPQLTQYFLNTPVNPPPPTVHRPGGRASTQANLAVSYSKMIRQMWHERRPPYAVPSGVAYGIKSVCPVFRGATQQDAQEFLRCFLDQLHDELKSEFIPKKVEAEGGGLEGSPDLTASGGQDPSGSAGSSGDMCRTMDSGRRLGSMDDEDEMADQEDVDEQADLDEGSPVRYSNHRRTGEDDLEVEIDGEPGDLDDEDEVEYEDHEGQVDEEMPSSSFEETGAGERIADLKRKGRSIRKASSGGDLPVEDAATHDLHHSHQRHLQQPPQQHHHHQHDNHEDDFETCDSGLSSEKSEASASDKNNIADNQRALEASLCNLLMGELQKAIASAGLTSLGPGPTNGAPDSKKPAVSYRSIISDVFDGRLLSSVQCFTCESISSTKEVFQDLSLPIPSRDHLERLHHVPSHVPGDLSSASSSSSLNSMSAAAAAQLKQQSLERQQGWMEWIFGWFWSWVWGPSVSLTDCLTAFFSADELKGDNMYSCGKCNKLRNGIKYSKLLELPEVLCIHLKRFRHELLFSTKISNWVSFPLEGLDMARFTHPHARDEVTSYDLVAVICHHGTASSGHYTSYAKNDCDGQWYEFDDTYVVKVDPSVVEACEAYVLFYRKSSEEMVKRRDHAADLIERSQCEQLDNTSPAFYISRRWVNRFNTFAEPGPIDNDEFICPHGGLSPSVADGDLVLFSQSVWEYLLETFKGGPAITTTKRCTYCLDIQRVLLERRFAKFSLSTTAQQRQQQQLVTAAEAAGSAGTKTEPCESPRQSWIGKEDPGGAPGAGRDPSVKAAEGAETGPACFNDSMVGSTAPFSNVRGPRASAGSAAVRESRRGPGSYPENGQRSAPMETSDSEEASSLEGNRAVHTRPDQLIEAVVQQGEQRSAGQQLHNRRPPQVAQTMVDHSEEDEVLTVERPASIAIDSLLDNVVLKMTSARVTDPQFTVSPGSVQMNGSSWNHNAVLMNGGDAAEVDSAFCSPMDGSTSREFSSLVSSPEDVSIGMGPTASCLPGPAILQAGDCAEKPSRVQEVGNDKFCSVQASVVAGATRPSESAPQNTGKRTSRSRRSRDKRSKNRW